jgi:hypothetical protein
MEDDIQHQATRRRLLAGGGIACAVGILGGVMRQAGADEHSAHQGGAKGVPAIVIEASREGICGTCRFWGGMRRVSEDRKSVNAESLGWCNNVDSPHFQTMRTPEAGPMKAWRKWEAL